MDSSISRRNTTSFALRICEEGESGDPSADIVASAAETVDASTLNGKDDDDDGKEEEDEDNGGDETDPESVSEEAGPASAAVEEEEVDGVDDAASACVMSSSITVSLLLLLGEYEELRVVGNDFTFFFGAVGHRGGGLGVDILLLEGATGGGW